MKRAVILHGTSADHTHNWFPWLKIELERRGYTVWVPDLPEANKPNIERYNDFLLNSDWDFTDNLVIGHSSGAVAILGLLQALPSDTKIDTAILAGAFTKRLSESPSWEMLRELFGKPFDFKAIKQKASKFIFVHSEDDPYCPIEQAQYLCGQLDGEFVKFNGMKHFSYSLDKRFKQFPELLEIIDTRIA
ncbi:MAG TPA: alpha/beta hydrolase [Candidatus Dormibacteraeota bacterium]|nr:alpha/beta hydrolase [Candidatus Dormibacteraeota bacterium]